ncbi:hypothetical protein [Nocardia veterana]|uniref:Uncharacterized protein n=1 Tax=Nocardia veterana TaxID=132249 RepID=A0A7X6RJJ8_9NOCA|nr:hypothetical protein [Nocardia veterana]NKY87664.1 hypothetical protein [Nocardia veterana]
MDAGNSGIPGSSGDPDDDHPNPVGDTVLGLLRAVLGRFGRVGSSLAERLK